MTVDIFISTLSIIFIQQRFIPKIQGKETCLYSTGNQTATIECKDECCSDFSQSAQTACCSHVPLATISIPFFIIAGICILGICIIYCRPFWKACFCGMKCPCENRSRVSSPNRMAVNENPIFVLNNDDLPDYETITKDSTMKDITPPPYNFVAAHPNDFGIDSRIPSAPPEYRSRSASVATTNPDNSFP